MLPFDRIVLSTDDNPMFMEFLPLVTMAWRRFFPGINITLAWVTHRKPNDPNIIIATQVLFTNVIIFHPHPDIPDGNFAKVARHLAAGMYSDEVCVIHDIDTVPLQRPYYIDLFGQREPGKLLCVGAELYMDGLNDGKFPAALMCGEGRLFNQLFGDNIETFIGMKRFDEKEDITNPPEKFSDESLVRALLVDSDIPSQHIPRGFNSFLDGIDRAWWYIDSERLHAGGLFECNLMRPWHEHTREIQPIVDYLHAVK